MSNIKIDELLNMSKEELSMINLHSTATSNADLIDEKGNGLEALIGAHSERTKWC